MGLFGGHVTFRVVASMTNIGERDASNVTLYVKATSQDKVVNLNNKETLEFSIGTLAAGERKEEQPSITVSGSLLYLMGLQNNGIVFNAEVVFDGGQRKVLPPQSFQP